MITGEIEGIKVTVERVSSGLYALNLASSSWLLSARSMMAMLDLAQLLALDEIGQNEPLPQRHRR